MIYSIMADMNSLITIEHDTPYPGFSIKNPLPDEVGTTVFITINNQTFTTIIDANGLWSWKASTPFPDGDYSVAIRYVDLAGNSSDTSQFSMVIDTTPPEAPILLNMYDDVGNKQGSFDSKDITDDSRPTLTGQAQKGAIVYLKDASGKTLGSAVADEVTGIWKLTPDTDLKNGSNSLTLVAVEMFAGKERIGAETAPFIITIANDSPSIKPEITHAWDDMAPFTGMLADNAVTDDKTPILHGHADANSIVYIHYRNANGSWLILGTAVVDSQGQWFHESKELAAGEYEFSAQSSSIMQPGTNVFKLNIVETASFKPTIDQAWDDVGKEIGVIDKGGRTDDRQPTLNGQAEANSIVQIEMKKAGGAWQSGFSVIADAQGNWKFTPDQELALSQWSFRAKTTTGNYSDSYDFTIIDDQQSTGSKWDFETYSGNGWSFGNHFTYDGLDFMLGKEFNYLSDPEFRVDYDPTLKTNVLLINTNEKLSDEENIVTLKLPEKCNYFQLDAIAWDRGINSNWDKGENYLSFYNDQHQEIGRVYHDPKIIDDIQQLKFYTAKNEISYVEFHFDPASRGLYRYAVDNISVKRDYDPFFDLSSGEAKFGEQLVGNDYRGTDSLHFGNIKYHIDIALNFSLTADKYTHAMKIPKWSQVTLEVEATDKVSFTLGAYDDSNDYFRETCINYYSINNKLLYSVRPNPDGGDYTYTAPAGERIGSVKFVTGRIDDDTSLDLMNFKWGSASTHASASDIMTVGKDIIVNTVSDLSELEGILDVNELVIRGDNQVIDLGSLSQKISSLAQIDITGCGNNMLKVDIDSLLTTGEKDLFIADGKTQMLVKGNKGDIVKLSDILPQGMDNNGDWVKQNGNITISGVNYNVYSHGNDSELFIQQGIKIEMI
ncbi:hypothetical protein K5Y32_08760 [Pantoea sp. DY-15]|uniref:Ig-like domain-containing protein n=1 Tax=Pantoea sp. DY-15 TaxID=2871489 RepID=UPI001C968067|nr:Ig-like domain-containing protein [Pantoea sp. DY-15]MBY4888026.1 hypothetical protein [Pantoea sp. DY-15]